MKRFMTSAVLLICLIFSAHAKGEKEVNQENAQRVDRHGAIAPYAAPGSYFTGDVLVTPFFPDNETARYSGAYVTFSRGARTAWHSHPAGQREFYIVHNPDFFLSVSEYIFY